MAELQTLATRPGAYETYGEYFSALRSLASEYGNLPQGAFQRAWAQAALMTNPYIQNERVKRVSTMPGNYKKKELVEMLKSPLDNEKPLREIAAGLEWTAYPFLKIRSTYQAINTCHFYHFPAYLEREDAKNPAVKREGVLLDKFNRELQPGAAARRIIGEAWKEGKVFYTPRYSVDKAHNAVNYAMLQKLPSDWCKIVGWNSKSKYTVMFNMMYFLTVPGSSTADFGDLFDPFMKDFADVLEPFANTGRLVYASQKPKSGDWGINLNKVNPNAPGSPVAYNKGGRWFYFVTLPAERCWTFEIDDTTPTVAPMDSGLFISFSQISDVEDVALSVMQNPLVSIAFGEIPYYNEKTGTNAADPIKLSPTGREYMINEWAQMLAAFNAGGIGFFPAPVSNLHMETLPEVTGSSEMTTKQYGYAVLKSGMSGLIPINSDPRAGAVEISAKLEEQMCKPVYATFSRMMEHIYKEIGTKYTWRFEMFGGFVSDAADLENARKGMTLGILSETAKYLALRGMSLWDDLSLSSYIAESGVQDLRLPLVSSYHMSQEKNGGLPPQAKDPDNEGGRPTKGIDTALSEGGEAQEADLDG